MTLSACSTGENNQLSASGTFSALETNISSEISGKVTEINVREGDEVEVGQALFKIDDEVIQAQYDQASAAVNAAEAAVETAVNQAASADAQYQLLVALWPLKYFSNTILPSLSKINALVLFASRK